MSVREAYDRWAAQYDDNRNRTRDLDMQCLRRADLPLPGARVFEAGCGTGLNTEFLAGQGARVVAMDFSEAMLERARARLGQSAVRFEAGDITQRWPAEDASCNLVVVTLVLEHVEDLSPVFAEAQRVLRKGGLLYIAELHPYRQLAGGQARFTREGSDREEFVRPGGIRYPSSLPWLCERASSWSAWGSLGSRPMRCRACCSCGWFGDVLTIPPFKLTIT